jgi:MFS family permease
MAPAGWLAERYGARRVLAGGVAIWSVATLLTGLANGLIMLLLLRLLLGLGESTAFPSASKALASEVPVSQLGLANGVLSFGYLVGPAIGTYLGGMLMASFGWRPVFVLFGCLSLLWLWPWLRTPHRPTAKATVADGDIPSFARILRQRGLWGASLGHFATNYSFYFILAWLPIYLVKVRGFDGDHGRHSRRRLPDQCESALLMGWATDSWCRAGRSPDLIYKGVMALSHVATIGCMVGMVLLPINGSIACLFGYDRSADFPSGCMRSHRSSQAEGGRSMGRCAEHLRQCRRIIAPALTGMLIDWSGSFVSAFVLAAAINVLGLVGWLFILPRIAP